MEEVLEKLKFAKEQIHITIEKIDYIVKSLLNIGGVETLKEN